MFDRCDWRRFRCRSRDLIGDCRSTDAEMDFDDHDDPEEEIGLPVGSGYEPQLGNSGRSASGGGKVAGGGGGGGGGEGGMVSAGAAAGSSNRKVSGGGGGGRYRECLKNHAVSIGGHAVDGCGEFMAAGEEGTLDALRCAACGCHRNFYRKEVEGGGLAGAGAIGVEYHHQFSPYYRMPVAYLHPHHHMVAAAAAVAQQQHRPPPLALSSTSGGGEHSRDNQEDISNPMMGGGLELEEEGEWRRGELTEGRAARPREEKNIAVAATEGKKGREGRLPGRKEDHLEEKITTGISRRMLE